MEQLESLYAEKELDYEQKISRLSATSEELQILS